MARPPGIEKVIRSQSNGITDCPTCGRYVGPLEICPFCRAIHRKRPIIVWFKYLTPILAILGMFGLKYMGDTMGNPLMKIGDLGRTSNFAYVQLEGKVCAEPRFYHAAGTDDPTAGTMEFCLDDGSGQTRVKTYEDATRRILRQRKVPSRGDTVHVTGNFQTRTHKHSLIVGSPHEIEITQKPIVANLTSQELAWSAPDSLDDNARVVVEGTLRKSWNDRAKGKYTVVLFLDGGNRKDENGFYRNVRVELPWSRLEMDGTIPRGANSWENIPAKGSKLRVTGVAKYKDSKKYSGWRLYAGWVTDIEVVGGAKEVANDQ